ncbi:hypothetical protein CC78DRAFT_541295 [Lojkania enalia]|uniref:Aminoglycoside phosphotransferase domain-containing protein n=1 Tax=Lojkania enalia TaxID=147567 RepID=A0A9P4N839_9PLEO|nr:hypothetical protein CC78DRAFT_541295 [Didymosphaeria enalia]
MPSPPSPTDISISLLAKTGLQLQSIKTLQSLWAGYGYICHATASRLPSLASSGKSSRSASASNSGISTPEDHHSLILKLITPPPANAGDEGHMRKMLSYQVEQYFYSHLAPLLPPSIPVAKCLASINEQQSDGTSTTAMILTDLRQTFPIAGEKREALSVTQVHAALDWLSSFHGFWWPRVKDIRRTELVHPPIEEFSRNVHEAQSRTVWLNGGYTYLATRRSEFANLAADHDSEWREPLTDSEEDGQSISEIVASILAPRGRGRGPAEGYMTLIHGDVKSENLFTSRDGKEVAFYDFQYTGLGLGVCDLTKLFTCSVPLSMLVGKGSVGKELAMQEPEKELLDRYLLRLKEVSGKGYEWDIFVRHWETALVDWLRFQASWGFWGNTKWLEARVRHILKDEEWRSGVAGNRSYA